MTNKKKRGKKKNKEKKYKSKDDRIKQIDLIKSKLSGLGLSNQFDGIKKLYKECDLYVETGNSWNGLIKLNGLKRIMDVILTNRKDGECSIILKYDENV